MVEVWLTSQFLCELYSSLIMSLDVDLVDTEMLVSAWPYIDRKEFCLPGKGEMAAHPTSVVPLLPPPTHTQKTFTVCLVVQGGGGSSYICIKFQMAKVAIILVIQLMKILLSIKTL